MPSTARARPVCPACYFPLDGHSDLEAALCYSRFLRRLQLLEAERYAPLARFKWSPRPTT